MQRNAPLRLVFTTSSHWAGFHEHQQAIASDAGVVDENVDRAQVTHQRAKKNQPPTIPRGHRTEPPARALREPESRPPPRLRRVGPLAIADRDGGAVSASATAIARPIPREPPVTTGRPAGEPA